jgi:PleD family two-component response regulator
MMIQIDEPANRWFQPDFRLLYVGSDRDFFAALRNALRAPGYLVVSCPDRGSANLFLKSNIPYNLFLFTLEMRNTMGLEFLRSARSLAHREATPVIVVAPNERSVELQTVARQAGADDGVSKARDRLVVMTETINRWLRLSRKRPVKANHVLARSPAQGLQRTGATGLSRNEDVAKSLNRVVK